MNNLPAPTGSMPNQMDYLLQYGNNKLTAGAFPEPLLSRLYRQQAMR